MSQRKINNAGFCRIQVQIVLFVFAAAVLLSHCRRSPDGSKEPLNITAVTPDGSVTDLVAGLKKDVTPEQVNNALERASEQPQMKGIMRVTKESLVSHDIIGDPHSATVDAESTMVMRNNIAKVLSWYDNEWGYSARLVDFARFMAERGI